MSKNHATIDLTAGFIVMAGMLTVDPRALAQIA